jgi:HAD superfamily hydrolase (TIGR01509 family)
VRALVFDCDGVLADTERFGHLPAFNQAFEEFGLPIRWSETEYREKLAIGGGKERVASVLTPAVIATSGLPETREGLKAWLGRFHARKTEIFQAIVASGRLPARPGVQRIAEAAAAAGWTVAVASTSAEPSVRAVLEHSLPTSLAARFAVFAGDVVPEKKPSPAIYRLALAKLSCSTEEMVVVEDSRNGLLAAHGAGVRCVVTVSTYTHGEDFSEAALVVTSLGDAGEPAAVLAGDSAAAPTGLVTLDDLEAVLRTTGATAV